ncbi:unnamed protein product [Rhodiola kirilowii]
MTSACLASSAFISKPQNFRLLRISSIPDSANSSGTCLPRPAVILPGLGNNTGDYEKLQMTLMEKGGVPSVVAKVSRFDWFRNAAGLVDANYWTGTLSPRPVLDWYLKRVDDAVREAKELAEGGTFSVIGHSAGGWLARVYMEEFGRDGISLLLTWHSSLATQCAKPEYTPEVKYVCIAGRYIQGSPIVGPSDVASDYTTTSLNTIQPDSEAATLNDITKSAPPTLRARFVGQGYKQVCGRSDVWGDGVVPEVSAHLDGALNISLDGVYHSPVGSDDELRPWYGSPAIVDQWIHHLLH